LSKGEPLATLQILQMTQLIRAVSRIATAQDLRAEIEERKFGEARRRDAKIEGMVDFLKSHLAGMNQDAHAHDRHWRVPSSARLRSRRRLGKRRVRKA